MDSEFSPNGIKIVGIPRPYHNQSLPSQDMQTVSQEERVKVDGFEQFLRAAMFSEAHVAFRIQNHPDAQFVGYLSTGEIQSIDAIHSAFLAQFPRFQTRLERRLQPLSIAENVWVGRLTGAPASATHSLNGAVQTMIRSDSSSFYQATAVPRTTKGIKMRIRRYISRRRYESNLERADRQTEDTSLLERGSKRKVNADALRKSKRYERDYQRLCADYILSTSVILAFWGSPSSRPQLASVVNSLLAAISSEDREERIKVKYSHGKKAIRLLQDAYALRLEQPSTLLSPREAVPYFQIPTIELGLTQTNPAQFSTSSTLSLENRNQSASIPFREGNIAIGPVYRQGTLHPNQVKYIDLQALKRHLLIVGMTDTGKSNTKNRIVIDAWWNRVPSLLIEPVKEDSRILMGAIPKMRVFTLGKESVAPFRQNPFLVDDGVPVQTHIHMLYACFVAGWPLFGMLSNHTRKVLTQLYTHHGYDIVHDIRGEKITLEMFREEAERYSQEVLRYGSELSQDYYGALIARAEDLCDPPRAAIFNTMTNLPMTELFSVPTIVELKHLGDPELTAFVLSLFLTRVYEYFDSLGPSPSLRVLLVIDEAHRVLEELPRTLDMSEGAMARRMVVDQFVNLIAEARSYGLGVVLADQIPTRLARNALKNCHTTIIHKLKSADDRILMAQETSCNAEQRDHITAMRVGEAVFSDSSSVVPANVQVFHDPAYHLEMNRVWSDEDVCERMRPFYEAHPEFAKTPEIPAPLSRMEDRSVALTIEVEDVVRSESFQALWTEAVEKDAHDPLTHHLEELLAHYAGRLSEMLGVEAMRVVERIVSSAEALYKSPSRPPDRAVVRQLLSGSPEPPARQRTGEWM